MPGLVRNALVPIHRYAGIPMSVVFVIWLVSGIVMIYTGGMPSLARSERIARLDPLDLAAVEVTPAAALEAAGFAPDGMRLVTVMGRPAYRLATRRGSTTVFADTGELLGRIDAEQAREIAGRFTRIDADSIRYQRTVTEPDQWTLTLAGSLPLIKLAAADAPGTQIYVSVYEAEVVLVTHRLERALAWAGAIPHWFYVTPLRRNQPLWYWTVVATAAAGTCLAVIGLILGIVQLRATRPFRLRASIPYSGWLHWHHLLGLLFGLFATTWAFSGLLSMEPLDWTRVDGGARLEPGALSGRLDAARFGRPDPARVARAAGGTLKELELVQIRGEPHYVAHVAPEAESVLLDAATLARRTRRVDTAALVARLERAVPGFSVVDSRLLAAYDSYYYARGGGAPLPVLRAKLDDPAATWVYVDAVRGRLVGVYNRRERLERWLYHGLHRLDFAFWYDRRPLWDVGMIALSLGALATSGLGLYLGCARIRRFTRRMLARRGARGS